MDTKQTQDQQGTSTATAQIASRRLTAPTLTGEIAERVRAAAAKDGRSVSNFIAQAVKLHADRVLGITDDEG